MDITNYVATKRKVSDEEVAPSLLSPMKPIPVPPTKPGMAIAPNPSTCKPVPRKAQPAISEFSTTPFLTRQGSVIPQASPSLVANTSVMGRPLSMFGGRKPKHDASIVTTCNEDTTESTTLDNDNSLVETSANTSLLTEGGLPKKKKRKLNGGTGSRTLLAVPDESPVHGLTCEFGVSTLMLESPAERPKFGGRHLLSSVKKTKGGLLWGTKKGGFKLDMNVADLISPEKTNEKMRDIKKGFTLKS
jgi:hypothetical protein